MNMIRLTPEQFESHQARIKGGIASVVADLKKPSNKFGAVKTVVDGITFDSRHEAEVYTNLRAQQAAGQITELKTHVPLQMQVAGVHIGTLVVDFVFTTPKGKKYQDAKGYRKGSAYQLFKLKAKIIAATKCIFIEEV